VNAGAALFTDFVAIWSAAKGDGNVSVRVFSAAGLLGSALLPQAGQDAGTCLPRAACELFRAARRASRAAPLLLDPGLPAACHDFLWEGLHLDGTPLSDALVVVRRAHATFGSEHHRRGRSACVSLFPRREFDFERRFEKLVDAEKLSHRPSATLRSLDGFDELFILAHGGAGGLLATDNAPFSLPPGCALPRRVWLLACEVDGAMARLAEELLARGVEQVVVAIGELDAAQMAEIVEAWLSRTGEPDVLHWLAGLRHDTGNGDGGARALAIWGAVRLDDGEAAHWNERTWRAERDGETRALELDDRDRRDFDRALGPSRSAALWPATGQWLLPQLLWLSERYGHEEMVALHEQSGACDSTAADHALSDVAYRLGRYPEAVMYLSSGLGRPDCTDHERAHLFGSLANILIDQNLPAAARRVADLHEEMAWRDHAHADRGELKRLDWRARMALRRGDFEAARLAMDRKRTIAMAVGEAGDRELAWLLYTAAWRRFAGANEDAVDGGRAHALADAALARLETGEPESGVRGNDDGRYLLRALAAWAWADQGWEHCVHLQEWLPLLRERLAAVDPGPEAFSLAYLHLAGHAGHDDLQRSIAMLEGAGYLLEAAGFAALAGQHEGATHHLERYRKRRESTLANLAQPPEVRDMADGELASRLAAEADLLSGDSGLLARQGVFPM